MILRNTLCGLLLLALCPLRCMAADDGGPAAQRRAFSAALQAARSGPPGSWQVLARGLEDYPLQPYLPYTAMLRDLDRADPRLVAEFLARHEGSLLADQLRSRWLQRLAARGRWHEFLDAWRPRQDASLRCLHAQARIAGGDNEGLATELRELWLSATALPTECDAVSGWLKAHKHLDTTLVWQRIELAAAARNAALVRTLAGYLPATAGAEAKRYAALLADPAANLAKAVTWADTPRARRMLALGVAQLARRDDTMAAARWDLLESRFAFDDADRARAVGAIALNKAASYDPDAAAWMARLPAEGLADDVREWRLREAVARRDWPAANAALGGLSAAQQLDARFRWVRGRVLELQGQVLAAQAVWEALAAEANFHGFLAADRLDRPYTICPQQPSTDPTLRAAVAANAGLQRAFEWLALGEHDDARREWNHTLAALEPAQRPIAVELALARDWIDRGPLTLLRPDETRYYALRFPLAHRSEVDRHARRNGLDRGLVYGLIRAESAWVTDARSSADARGLMQMLPGTARRMAKLEHLPYAGPNDLYRPALSIALGTRYLAEGLAHWGARAWVTAAAYNAGPAPVRRWLDARGGLPPDLWIETIPYRETREYVSRVLAFATLYDWRLGDRLQRVSTRIGLDGGATTPATVACTTAPGGNPQAGNP